MKQFSRRRFLAAVGAASAVRPRSMVDVAQGFSPAPGQQDAAATRVGKDALKAAESVAGLRFAGPEREMAVAGVTRNVEGYEALRALDISLDVEPPLAFRPYPPGNRPKGRATRNAPLAIATSTKHVRVTPRLEELAFEPVTVLSSLIKSRRITSTGLTKMYLARLERYGEPLHCVVT